MNISLWEHILLIWDKFPSNSGIIIPTCNYIAKMDWKIDIFFKIQITTFYVPFQSIFGILYLWSIQDSK